jgi:hypothetical protein
VQQPEPLKNLWEENNRLPNYVEINGKQNHHAPVLTTLKPMHITDKKQKNHISNLEIQIHH